jgi:hypothetical protein
MRHRRLVFVKLAAEMISSVEKAIRVRDLLGKQSCLKFDLYHGLYGRKFRANQALLSPPPAPPAMVGFPLPTP